MKYLQTYKLFESFEKIDEKTIRDILIELEDDDIEVEINQIRKDRGDKSIHSGLIITDFFLEIYIRRPYGSPDREIPGVPQPPGGKYPGNLIFWYEIKDAIIRLNDWYYSQSSYEPIDKETIYRVDKDKSPFRMFMSGIEFGIGWHKPEDFDGVGDYITSSSIRIEMKV